MVRKENSSDQDSTHEEIIRVPSAPPKFVAPDGGWGWMVVFASALSNVIMIPIMQSFGLLFKDKFVEMGMTATDCSIIINVNSAFGMGLGLLNGPLLRRFSFRKVAVAGSILVFIGVTGLAWANTFIDFLIMYSFITSLGIILTLSSFSLALNTYFKVRRGKAAGFAMTATGLGPIVMPQVISLLMQHYGVQGTALLLGGLSLHAFMAALLLQPVKWHVKSVNKSDLETDPNNENNKVEVELIEETYENNRTTKRRYRTVTNNSEIDLDIDTKSMYGFETPLIQKRRYSAASESQYNRGRPKMLARSVSQVGDSGYRYSHPPAQLQSPPPPTSFWSAETVNLGSSVKIFDGQNYYESNVADESRYRKTSKDTKIQFKENVDNFEEEEISLRPADEYEGNEYNSLESLKQKSCFKRMIHSVVVFFDLDLLRDPHYFTLMTGMSIAACAELNFSLFTPFIMADMGFPTSKIAVIMSTIATADICFRFLAPYIADGLKISPQPMYTFALLLLVIARTTLTFFSSYHAVLAVGLFLGMAKGFRTVYMTLVIPAYVPLERLASASGIQLVTNGLIIMVFGPFLGVIRDWSGSYNTCIFVVNGLSLFTIIMWTLEMVIVRYRTRNSEIIEEKVT